INEQLSKANELSGQEASLKAEISELEAKLMAKPNSEKLEKQLSEKKKELKKVTKELGKYNIAELQSALEVCSGDLAEYKAQKEQYEAAKETDPTIGSQKAQQSALKEVSRLTAESAQQNFRKAQDGVVIDFNGIISQVDVAEGQMVTEGTPLFTLESLEKVKATISVSKYDLEKIAIGQKAKVTINGKEYNGTLSAINKIAQANQSGTPMVNVDIHIENPDDYIFLGIEAKVSLETAKKEKTLLIPVECVNSDMNGDFCWVVINGIVTRKDIETGISTDTYMEILSGLEEGDRVVTDMTAALEEGMEVMPVEEEANSAAASE
ncbi:MAG: efflux RND transporter periplasmic adaptor subunit, partial [Lachnospiraceae bacterium]|nr:efflux RND transporter periplasmic adaptor subunit [Lachnospiraceae bacterium]